ncbi:serine/threonine protein kinase [Minicystis rosea]|nr:serine/threonine protein kinase [Minicystis rosea]
MTAASSGGSGGNSLGKYRLIAELGHGGMAEVFLAVVRGPAGFNKLVVIKQIRPQLAEDPEFLGMFLDEARLAARLSHPNVVQTNEVGQEDERYFIAMEYLEGQPLNRVIHRLQKGGGFPLAMHLKVVCNTLAGLHHAHELTDYDGTALGVVHRDVTPHNVFVTYDGLVKVVDFGIAKALNSSSETRTGVLKGKVAYMAPEQARGERVDRRADIFSVGVMLWEAATGKRLWKGVPDITILQRLLAGDIPTPRSVKPDIPEKLEAIILKALSQQRDDRHASAADLQLALEGYLEESGERIHERDIGKLIALNFEADRAKIKTIIDEQLRARPTVDVQPAALPVIDQHTHSSSRSSISDAAGSAPSKVEIVGAGGSGSSPSYTAPSALFTSSASTPGDPVGRSRRGLVAGLALGAGALLALGIWQVTKAPAPVAAAASATVADKPTSAPQLAEVEISITATPAEAKLYLDDKPLPGNPWKGKLAKDGASHPLRIEAPGFTTRTDVLTLERDRSMEVVLVKEPAVDKPARHTGPAAAPPPPPPEDLGRPNPKKPQRTLDTSNPYQ